MSKDIGKKRTKPCTNLHPMLITRMILIPLKMPLTGSWTQRSIKRFLRTAVGFHLYWYDRVTLATSERAIKTMGFTDLRVVAPVEPEYRTNPDAVAFSTSSVDVLKHSRDYPSLEAALTDVALPFAMTGYSRRFGPALETMRQSADRAGLWAEENKGPGIAFVFGCERSGLTNEEVGLCRFATAIPANPLSQSLNLAQAVQIAAYEMHMALLQRAHAAGLYGWQQRFEQDPAASAAAVEGLMRHWEEAMTACGAHKPEEPKNLMAMSRSIFSRALLTQSEVDLLRGICAAIICPRHLRAGRKKPLVSEKNQR